MSISYTISFRPFSRIKLEQLMNVYLDNTPEISYKSSEEKDAYILFARGSIRGISVRQEMKNKLNVRCNVLPSKTDSEILYGFLKWIGTDCKGKIIDESGVKLSGRDLTLEDIMSQMSEHKHINLLETILQEESYVKLPVWDGDIVVCRDKFEELKGEPNYPEVVFTYLQEKSFRIFHARRAQQIKTNRNTISIWAYDDVLMVSSQLVGVRDPDDEDNYIFFPWDHFLSSPEIRYEEIPLGKDQGVYYFISAVNDERIPEVLKYLKQDFLNMGEI